jgi:hypothetical protein
MSRLPFTVYDFFAFLSSGSIVLAALGYFFGPPLLFEKEPTAAAWVVLIVAAYIVGHIVSQFSSRLYEGFLVDKVLRPPSETLMGGKHSFWPHIFWLYYDSLEKETQERIENRKKSRKFHGTSKALFDHILGVVKHDADTLTRLDEFLNTYTFCRNVSLAFLIVAILIWVGPTNGRPAPSWLWGLVFLALAVAMLYRYLKFFRQYSYELFVTYAELDSRGKS